MIPLEEYIPLWSRIRRAVRGSARNDGYNILVGNLDTNTYCSPGQNNDSMGTESLLKQTALFLLPSFISCYWKPPRPEDSRRKNIIHSLDGLRGLACLCVFNDHFFRLFQLRSQPLPHILFTPFLSSIHSGKAAVAIFFVISGYVLSHKSIQLMRKQQFQEFQKTITSSVLRRAIRLCLPPFIAACLLCILTIFGGYDQAWVAYEGKRSYLRVREPPPKVYDNTWKQIKSLMSTKAFLLNSLIPWQQSVRAHDYHLYDVHIWTIPHELRCSMALFTLLVATSRMKAMWRVLAVVVLTHHVWGTRQINVAFFFTGMLLTECDIAYRDYFKSSPVNSARIWRFSIHWSRWDMVWMPLFMTGWYFHSSNIPTDSDPTFIFCAGTAVMIWATANSTLLNNLFTNPFSAYMGRLSYALYLVHGGIIRSLGYASLQTLFAIVTGTPVHMEQDAVFFEGLSNSQRYLAYMLGNIFIFPICIWVADIFCRLVDEPSVRLARRFEQMVSIRAEVEHEKQGAAFQDSVRGVQLNGKDHRTAAVAERGEMF